VSGGYAVSGCCQRTQQSDPGDGAVGGNIFTDLGDENGIKSPGHHADTEQDIAEVEVQIDDRCQRTFADEVDGADNAGGDTQPLQLVQAFVQQYQAEQRSNGWRQRGDDGKVGDGRILQARKLCNIVAANTEHAHQKQRQPGLTGRQQLFAAVSQCCQQHYAYGKIPDTDQRDRVKLADDKSDEHRLCAPDDAGG